MKSALKITFLAALLLVSSACGCEDTGPPGDQDAGPDARIDATHPEAGIPDAGPEAAVPDARVYPDCDVPLLQPEVIIPDELIRLPPTGQDRVRAISWDGRYVAYTQVRCPIETDWRYDAFLFDLETMQESVLVARFGNQWDPSVAGNSVVFADSAYLLDPTPENDHRIELFHYDILSGEETQLTDGNWPKLKPLFNGTHAVYLSDEWDPSSSGSSDLVLHNVASGQELILADHNQNVQWCYDISEEYVTWMAVSPSQAGAWDIFYHHIPSGITDRLHLDTPYLFCSSVSGNRLAWNEARSGFWDVYVMDLDTGIEEQITDEQADQILVRTSSNLITWFDYRHTGGSFPSSARDLYLHDIETGISRRLTVEARRWALLRPTSCQRLAYGEKYDDYLGTFYVWDLVAAGVLDQDCHVIPCDPETEVCATIEWRGP